MMANSRTQAVWGGVALLAAALVVGCEGKTEIPDCTSGQETEQCGVFQAVNRERASDGLPALEYDVDLALAAQRHAEDMAANGYFDHTSQDGRDFSQRATEAGYTGFARGENIAQGQRGAEAVMESWMNSPGHRANILSDGSNQIGVGFAESYWVQVFGMQDEDE